MLSRRRFFGDAARATAVIAAATRERADAGQDVPRFTRTVISGAPRERGRRYGQRFEAGIRGFLDREIYGALIGGTTSKEDALRYADACARTVRAVAPVIHEELEGMAEGSGVKLEELVLLSLHEELYHRGVLPKVPHCTAVAAGHPVTSGRTYVGQTWDWMTSVAGLSTMVQWERPEGPSVLGYGFPGLWIGAGLNAAGLALCWTSADLGNHALGVRVGMPSYLLLTHLLYQESLEAVEAEARRAQHAGWFTFVMADGQGDLLNIEGSPAALAVERHRGRLVRVGYGSRAMTGTPEGGEVPTHARCRVVSDLLAGAAGTVDHGAMQGWFQDPDRGICVGPSTIDMMVFDATVRRAYVSRGPSYGVQWQEFGFGAGPRS